MRVTICMSLHSWHSKVRMWKPKWLGVVRASVVTVLQVGHSGRKDMFARLIRREHNTLSHRVDAVTRPVMKRSCRVAILPAVLFCSVHQRFTKQLTGLAIPCGLVLRGRNPHRGHLLPLDKTNAIPGVYQEENMKISTIALAAVLAISSSSMALANHYYHHHHHHHHMHMTMGPSTGPSGPRMDGGGVDKSRAGGQGVSRKAAD
jgi:hypothetical protein